MSPLSFSVDDEIISSSLSLYDIDNIVTDCKRSTSSTADLHVTSNSPLSPSSSFDFPSIEWCSSDDDCEHDSSCESLTSSLDSITIEDHRGLKLSSRSRCEDFAGLVSKSSMKSFSFSGMEDDPCSVLRGGATAALDIMKVESTISESSWGYFILPEESNNGYSCGSMRRKNRTRALSEKQKRSSMTSPYSKQGLNLASIKSKRSCSLFRCYA
uniref:Uncharacterized protein n=2 Tax=Proboscia inermis TaxID=420281 RepID=A0A7S0C021_9STRA|mmetsp:Transcript_19603/g.24010  ORF Transcript_19603/g.24010 Transcript_19603/m.24010 type:complete len:213 (+) Transcript_19603:70-708(+)